MANCVGYAYGRFNEIVGASSCKYLAPVNAENFMQYKGNLETGMTPRVGACMVWQKGATLNGSDGAGHVAIVEQVISDTEIVTSESGYAASKPFWTQRRKKGGGNWGQASGYKFLGFIYNPSPDCKPGVVTPTTTPTTKPSTAKPVQKKCDVAKFINTSFRGTYQTTTDLYLRVGAGTGKTAIVLMPTGTKVQNYGYFNKDGTQPWLYVATTVKGVELTGYCHPGYLKKI